MIALLVYLFTVGLISPTGHSVDSHSMHHTALDYKAGWLDKMSLFRKDRPHCIRTEYSSARVSMETERPTLHWSMIIMMTYVWVVFFHTTLFPPLNV